METAEVTITDLSPETVELLLQYCYGCLLEMPTDHAEVRAFPTVVCSPMPLAAAALICLFQR